MKVFNCNLFIKVGIFLFIVLQSSFIGAQVDSIKTLFVSSESDSTIRMISYADTIAYNSHVKLSVIGDVIYDDDHDILYQIDNETGSIAYYEAFSSILDSNIVSPNGFSSSDFINAIDFTLFKNFLFVAQAGNENNGFQNKIITYTLDGNVISYYKETFVDYNIGDISVLRNTIYALEKNSNRIFLYDFNEIYNNLLTSSGTITVEGLSNASSFDFNGAHDLLAITDIGEEASSLDGAVVLVPQFHGVSSDGNIVMEEQVRIEGGLTKLGNPQDVVLDLQDSIFHVAEIANGGGRLLSFSLAEIGQSMTPYYDSLIVGATHLFLSDRQDNVELPRRLDFDPSFSSRLVLSCMLDGVSVLPPVETEARGLATFTFDNDFNEIVANITLSKVSGEISSVLIHDNVATYMDLTDGLSNGRIKKSFIPSQVERTKLINGDMYLSVFVDGIETITGNIRVESPYVYYTFMNAEGVMSSTDSEALGLLIMKYTPGRNVMEVKFLGAELAGEVTSIALNTVIDDEIGAQIEELSQFYNGSFIDTIFSPEDYITLLDSMSIQATIKTDSFPDGEIGGRIIASHNSTFNGLWMDSWLSGDDVVPSNNAEALGLAFGYLSSDLEAFNIVILLDGLSSDVVSADINMGDLFSNGSSILNINNMLGNNVLSSDDDSVDNDFARSFLSGDLHVDVKTASFPKGEIRGQLYKSSRETYAIDLCPEQVVYNVFDADSISGSALIAYDREYRVSHVAVLTNTLSSEFQGANIRDAMPFQNGNVIFNLYDHWENNSIDLYTHKFTEEVYQAIIEGSAYINIHTSANLSGELRGQVDTSTTCLEIVNTNDQAHDFFAINVYPNPANGILNLSVEDDGLLLGAVMKIYSSIGKLETTRKLTAGDNTIDISGLYPGLYFLQIEKDGIITTYRFTKQ